MAFLGAEFRSWIAPEKKFTAWHISSRGCKSVRTLMGISYFQKCTTNSIHCLSKNTNSSPSFFISSTFPHHTKPLPHLQTPKDTQICHSPSLLACLHPLPFTTSSLSSHLSPTTPPQTSVSLSGKKQKCPTPGLWSGRHCNQKFLSLLFFFYITCPCSFWVANGN